MRVGAQRYGASCGAVGGDLRLVAVADREQHLLGVDQVAAPLAVVLEDARLDDRVDRAALLAEAAEDALGEVDVVARGAARAVVALLGLDGDRERRAHRLAQLARDAALLAVRIAAQRVQAAEARALRRLLLRELHGDLAREQVPAGEAQALAPARAAARCRRSRVTRCEHRSASPLSGTGRPSASASSRRERRSRPA